MSETRDARPGSAQRPPPTPPRGPTPAAASAQSPKPPAVSGAGANVARAVGGKPLGPARARMATQIGVGMDGAGDLTPAAALPPVVAVEAPPPPDSADDDAWDASEAERAATRGEGPPPVPTPSPVALPRKMLGQAPPLPPPTPASPAATAARDPEQTAPHAAQTMSTSTREEVWAIVRAAVQDAVAPLVQQNKELVARLDATERGLERERVERERLVAQAREAVAAASARPPAATTTRPGGSIPIVLEPSIPPAPIVVPANKAPRLDDVARLGLTPTTPRVMPTAKMPVRVPGGSIPPTGLGVVVTPGQSADLDVSKVSVSALEIPDFGRRRRIMGRLIVAVMLLGVLAAVVMTILSHA